MFRRLAAHRYAIYLCAFKLCIFILFFLFQISFQLGPDDKQSLQPPLHPWVPVTGSYVYELANQIGTTVVLFLNWTGVCRVKSCLLVTGIVGLLRLVCGVLTQYKIVLLSSSFNRLTNGCHALVSVMYPLRYGPQASLCGFLIQ